MARTKSIDTQLKDLERRANEIGRQLREENRICQAELIDRLRLGLTGDDAIRHHNDWMMLHGLNHLVVD